MATLIPAVFAIDRVTAARTPLRNWTKLTLSPVANSPGALALDYPAGAPGFDVLHAQVSAQPLRALEVEIWLGGTSTGARRGYLLQKAGDDLTPGNRWAFSGHFLEWMLAKALIFQQAKTTTNPKGELVFAAATYGTVMATVVQQAQARGALPGITRDFTTTHDSNGVAWASNVTNLKFSPGATVLQVAEKGVELNLGEFEVTAGRVLRAYNPGTRGTDRTGGTAPLLFAQAVNLREFSRRESSRDGGTTVLAKGGEGFYKTASDATALAELGWRAEVAVDAGQITTETGVQAYANGQMPIVARGEAEFASAIEFGPGALRPLLDYDVGDRALNRAGTVTRALRIAQIELTFTAGGAPQGTVVQNDLVTDQLAALYRKLNSISSGDAVVGTSSTTRPDEGVPAAPTGLVVSSNIAYQLPGHTNTLSEVTVGWSPVATNVDGTAADDIARYRVRYVYLGPDQVGGLPSSNPDGGPLAYVEPFGSPTAGTSLTWGEVEADALVGVQVAAIDNSGNQSTWSARLDFTTAKDDQPPPVPSRPTGTPWFRTGDFGWDGKGSAGEAMPSDFLHVEVHIGPSTTFTPDRANPATSTTLKARLYGAGTWNETDLDYGVSYYARLVAVDQTGNASAPSVASPAVVAEKLVQIEIGPNAIGRQQIIDLEVIRGKMENLAVNSAKVEEMSVGLLSAGTMTARVLIAGIFETATSGTRLRVDSTGLILYNAANAIVGRWSTLDASMLMTGTYMSGLTGKRINILPEGTARFYPSAGTNYAQITNYGNDLVMRGVLDSSNRSGRVNVNALGVGLNFSRETELDFLYSEIGVFDRRIRITAPLTHIQVDGQPGNGVPDGSEPRVQFSTTDGFGVDIGRSFVYYRTDPSNYGGFSGNGAGIKFSLGQTMVCQGDDLANWGVIKAADFIPSSSQRLKEQIRDIGGALAKIRKLQPRRYKLTAEVNTPDVAAPDRFGVLAEEAVQAVPELIAGDPADPASLGVYLSSTVFLLVKAVNELADTQDQLARLVPALKT